MAHDAKPVHEKTAVLPPLVYSPGDIGRLINELEQVDTTLMALGLRSGGTEVKMPKTSRLMDMIVEENKLNLLKPGDRAALKKFLDAVYDGPRLHFSFNSDPSIAFMEKLMAWLRHEIHPYVLVTVGLQPNIGAGCIMRSTNKYFDFSLSQTIAGKRDILLAKLKATTPQRPLAPQVQQQVPPQVSQTQGAAR